MSITDLRSVIVDLRSAIYDRRSMIYDRRSTGDISPIPPAELAIYPGIPRIPGFLGDSVPRDPRKFDNFRGYLIILQFGTPQDTGFLGHPPIYVRQDVIYGQNGLFWVSPHRGGPPIFHMTFLRLAGRKTALFGLFGL